MTCYDRCPLRGEDMVLDMGYVPAVGESCVGCGMCEYVARKTLLPWFPMYKRREGRHDPPFAAAALRRPPA